MTDQEAIILKALELKDYQKKMTTNSIKKNSKLEQFQKKTTETNSLVNNLRDVFKIADSLKKS